MTARVLLVALALAGVGAVRLPAAVAQESARSRDALLKHAFADVSDRHRFGVGRVLVDQQPRAYGFLVREDRLLTVAEPLPKLDGAARLAVRFQGQVAFPARVVARDERWNLALLAVEPTELVDPVPVEQSDAPKLGRWVVAVGTTPVPMAVGAVSVVGRAVVELDVRDLDRAGNPAASLIRGGRRYREVFQYDAWLSSDAHHGMPLFDSGGRFVGISVETRTRGTSYAVPAARVREALPALLEGRSTAATRPGFIGIRPEMLTPDEARALGILGGVRIAEIINAQGAVLGPGDQPIGVGAAGARVGDVLVRIDGQEILDGPSLVDVVQLFNPGERVRVTVLRDGQPVELHAVIAERPVNLASR